MYIVTHLVLLFDRGIHNIINRDYVTESGIMIKGYNGIQVYGVRF